MKKHLAFALCLCVLLSGCSWMDGSYVSVTPHVVTRDQESDDTVQITSYSQLRNALTDMVDAGNTHGLFSLIDYPQERIDTDMSMAISYIKWNYPIGAYAVENVEFEYGSGGTQNVLSVDITYLHGKSEINRIQTVRGISGAQAAIASALRQCAASLVLQVTNYSVTDFAQLTADYAAEHPQSVMESPQVSYSIYPSSGDVRIVELFFTYQTSRESLRSMQSSVLPIFSSAQLYVSGNTGDYTKYSQLYTFLTERYDYTIETSITPSYSLLCHGVGDSKAFAQVYAAMCRQVGLECQVVSGTRDGVSRFWNIVLDGEIYYHVDLLRSMDEGAYRQRTDEEMQGYVWDYSAYPESLPPQTTAPETTVPPTTVPAAQEQPEE